MAERQRGMTHSVMFPCHDNKGAYLLVLYVKNPNVCFGEDTKQMHCCCV